MRTTLDLDDDVLAAAKEMARQQGQSTGTVVSGLLRRALIGASQTSTKRGKAGVAGFKPFASRGKAVTNDAIRALRDAEGV
jgi:Arc/MetJ family transcription regulator